MKTQRKNSWIDWIGSQAASTRKAILEELSPEDHHLLLTTWAFTARPAQLPPPGNWRVWLLMCGRGYGKTRAGAEFLIDCIRKGAKRVGVIGTTSALVRDVCVEGESGIMACLREGEAIYEPSKRRIVFENGALISCYSAEKSSQLRGPQAEAYWLDEAAAWRYPDAFDQAMLGLRLGDNPRCVITTTPRPRRFIRQIVNHPLTVVTTGSTKDNLSNLSPYFIDHVYDRYSGTALGMQELSGILLDEAPGALWTRASIENNRLREAPALSRCVVSVDPAVSDGEKSDESGIVVVGKAPVANADHYYILRDASFKGTPDAVVQRAIDLYHQYKADALVVEKNQGGDTWKAIAGMLDHTVNVRLVHASRGKWLRAEPVSALYQKNRVHHVGVFETMEDELCAFVQEGVEHDDRVDALVHGVTFMNNHAAPRFTFDSDKHYVAPNTAIWG